MVNTVEHNKTKYSDRDYSCAVLARKVQNMLGNPSYRQYCKLILTNQLKKCLISKQDVKAEEDIFGPSLACLKGRQYEEDSRRMNGINKDPNHNPREIPRSGTGGRRDESKQVKILPLHVLPYQVYHIRTYQKF